MKLARRPPWAQGHEVGMAVRAQPHRLAVDQGVGDGQGAHRLCDARKPGVEQGAAATPQLDALAMLSGEDPEAVVFHLMQPAQAGGRGGDEGRPTGFDETGRQRKVARTGHRQMPRHDHVCSGWMKAAPGSSFASGRLLLEVAGTRLAPTASRPRPSSFRGGRGMSHAGACQQARTLDDR
jgi:hypothetical protein